MLGGQSKGVNSGGDTPHLAPASRKAELAAGAGAAQEMLGRADAGASAGAPPAAHDSGDLLDSVLRSQRSGGSGKEPLDDGLDGIVVNVSDRDVPKVFGHSRQPRVHAEREERVHGMHVLGILDMPSAETLGECAPHRIRLRAVLTSAPASAVCHDCKRDLAGARGLPNADHPSDHLPLACRLAISWA